MRALVLAKGLREPGLAAEGERVAGLATAVAARMDLLAGDVETVRHAASLNGLGRLCVPDDLLRRRGPLSPADWQRMNGHVVAAADLLSQLPEVEPLAPVVRATHERWDGEGYPDGLMGEAIPLASRIVSACTTYVALNSERPYRHAVDEATALHQLIEVAGTQLDPAVVRVLVAEITGRVELPARERPAARAGAPRQRPAAANGRRKGDLVARIDALEPVPPLSLARERLLRELRGSLPARADVVAQIEVDPGLALWTLRAAGEVEDGRVVTIADAVEALGTRRLEAAIDAAPSVDFVWPRNRWERTLESFRLHSIAVQRATLRLAAAVRHDSADVLAVVSLLHDLGRVALLQLRPHYGAALTRVRTIDERLRLERRLFGLDHAAVGSIAARRWGLPESLAELIGEHHDTEGSRDARFVCLGDALAHQSQGTPTLSAPMLKLSYSLGLDPADLREISYELPHLDGSRRVRAEPSPLSKRQLDVLRGLSEGKVYGQIAESLGLSASTVRTHLHHAYSKLGVVDRAQAVLMARERGWL